MFCLTPLAAVISFLSVLLSIKKNPLYWAGLGISIFAFLVALPSLLTAIGLPPEGDAVDYHVPIIKWMLKYHRYPNWPWTVVDDFPMLAEILMLPFFAIYGGLGRLVTITAYFACAVFGALIVRSVQS